MPAYRLYCIDKDNHITARHDFDAPDDDAAAAYVRVHHADSDCELWEMGRLVARVPSQRVPQFAEPS